MPDSRLSSEPSAGHQIAGDAGGPGRIRALDCLRGLAAAAVMLFHYNNFVRDEGMSAFVLPVPWGHYGVQLFFIISGYVILLTVRRAATARAFVISRFARLYPAFWTACVVSFCILRYCLPPPSISLGDAILNLPMFDIPHTRLIDGAYWTLRQELWFYVVMAALLALRRADAALWVVGAIVVTSVFNLRFTRWFSLFLIGMVIFDSREAFRWKHGVLLFLCALDILRRSLWKKNTDPLLVGWEYPGVILVCALLVVAATRLRLPWMSGRVVVFMGSISYSLYLFHAPVGQAIIHHANRARLGTELSVGMAIVSAITLAGVVTTFVERPALRAIKERLLPKRSPAHGESPAR